MSRSKEMAGFTLIELMVVVAVAAILASIAIPSFRTLMMDNQITSQTNMVIGLVQAARSEAITQRSIVIVCGSSDATNCNAGWEQGAIIFRSTSNNATAATAATLLRVLPANSSGLTVSSSRTTIAVNPNGTLDNSTTLRICDSRGTGSSRAVTVNIAGVATSGANGTCP